MVSELQLWIMRCHSLLGLINGQPPGSFDRQLMRELNGELHERLRARVYKLEGNVESYKEDIKYLKDDVGEWRRRYGALKNRNAKLAKRNKEFERIGGIYLTIRNWDDPSSYDDLK